MTDGRDETRQDKVGPEATQRGEAVMLASGGAARSGPLQRGPLQRGALVPPPEPAIAR